MTAENNKLISMVEFVKEQSQYVKSDISAGQSWDNTYRYANFLSQPLELWMFVPAIDGEVLDNPKYLKDFGYYDINRYDYMEWDKEEYKKDLAEYNQAKERCLFEGFEYYNKNCAIHIQTGNYVDEEFCERYTIEDLLIFFNNITISPAALKTIYNS